MTVESSPYLNWEVCSYKTSYVTAAVGPFCLTAYDDGSWCVCDAEEGRAEGKTESRDTAQLAAEAATRAYCYDMLAELGDF